MNKRFSQRFSKAPKPDVVAEASAWFVEFRAGDASAGDRARFYEWLRRSPEHIHAYLDIAEGWAELPTNDPQGRLDMQALIQRAKESEDDNIVEFTSGAPLSRERPRPWLRAWAASLASVAVLVLVILGWRYEANSYRTGVGEQRMVRLEDGSIIELNAVSSVHVRFSDQRREIDLSRGQAMFQVAKDPSRPFIVRSGETRVQAVGTQFDVYRKASGTVVTVLEGRVSVTEANVPIPLFNSAMTLPEPVLLIAGEQMIVPLQATTESPAKPQRADVLAATAWVQRQLVFNETPLVDVAEEFNRYSTRRLVIADPALRSIGVSGVYSSTQPETVLGFLRAQPNLELRETHDEIRVVVRKTK